MPIMSMTSMTWKMATRWSMTPYPISTRPSFNTTDQAYPSATVAKSIPSMPDFNIRCPSLLVNWAGTKQISARHIITCCQNLCGVLIWGMERTWGSVTTLRSHSLPSPNYHRCWTMQIHSDSTSVIQTSMRNTITMRASISMPSASFHPLLFLPR